MATVRTQGLESHKMACKKQLSATETCGFDKNLRWFMALFTPDHEYCALCATRTWANPSTLAHLLLCWDSAGHRHFPLASLCRWLSWGFLLQIMISSHMGNTLIKHIQPSELFSLCTLLFLCGPIPPHAPTPCFFLSLVRTWSGFTAIKILRSLGFRQNREPTVLFTTMRPLLTPGRLAPSDTRRRTDSQLCLPQPQELSCFFQT